MAIVGGDERVGQWPGYVTATVHTAVKRLMGHFDLTWPEALARLRATSERNRGKWRAFKADSPQGRALIGNAGGAMARVEAP